MIFREENFLHNSIHYLPATWLGVRIVVALNKRMINELIGLILFGDVRNFGFIFLTLRSFFFFECDLLL